MTEQNTATREEWLVARRALLEKEKAHTRMKDEITKERQALPWVRVEKEYSFETPEGPRSLADLFQGHSQLIVYHFMYGAEWKNPCVSCSLWADNFNGLPPHLAQKDIGFVTVSSAPLAMIAPFKTRMGWDFDWVSSEASTFNADFNVGFGPGHPTDGPLMYNFREVENMQIDELPGISVFARGDDGAIFHTYSAYSRGLDITNSAYSYIDMTPRGRDEPVEGNKMGWVKHRDAY